MRRGASCFDRRHDVIRLSAVQFAHSTPLVGFVALSDTKGCRLAVQYLTLVVLGLPARGRRLRTNTSDRLGGGVTAKGARTSLSIALAPRLPRGLAVTGAAHDARQIPLYEITDAVGGFANLTWARLRGHRRRRPWCCGQECRRRSRVRDPVSRVVGARRGGRGGAIGRRGFGQSWPGVTFDLSSAHIVSSTRAARRLRRIPHAIALPRRCCLGSCPAVRVSPPQRF